MTSDETQIQIFTDWLMSHSKRVTKARTTGKIQFVMWSPRPGKETANRQNCPAEKSSANHVTYKQHIGPKTTYRRENNGQSKHNDAKDRKRKCCRFT